MSIGSIARSSTMIEISAWLDLGSAMFSSRKVSLRVNWVPATLKGGLNTNSTYAELAALSGTTQSTSSIEPMTDHSLNVNESPSKSETEPSTIAWLWPASRLNSCNSLEKVGAVLGAIEIVNSFKELLVYSPGPLAKLSYSPVVKPLIKTVNVLPAKVWSLVSISNEFGVKVAKAGMPGIVSSYDS